MQGLACGRQARFLQEMQVLSNYVPDPNNDAVPDNIAGEYYTVHKLAHPIAEHDLDMHIEYVELVVKALQQDKQRTKDFLLLLCVLRNDKYDERDLIYKMAKLINSYPVLFLGFSALLKNYQIERRGGSTHKSTHPVTRPVDMQHIDMLFDLARTKNDVDINTIVRTVKCFREFAKRVLFDSGINVAAALDMMEGMLSDLPDDTQQKIEFVQSVTEVSQREALHRLVFCNMNIDAAIQNVYQDRSAMKIMQLVEGCTEDRAQMVLRNQNNNVNQAVDYLMSLKDDVYFGAPDSAPVLSAGQRAHAFKRAIKRFMDTTGEDSASAQTWLQKYGGNGDMAIEQFLEFDDATTKAGRIIIDATAATLNLRSIEVPGGRGHCFYLAMSQQLALHGVYLTFEQLRAIAANNMEEEFQKGASSLVHSIYSSIEPPCKETFKNWCLSMAADIRYSGPNPVWADDLSISCLLNGLLKNVIVVRLRIIASRQGSTADRRILELQPSVALSAPGAAMMLLTVCHVYGRHYLGTLPITTSVNIVDNDDTLPMFIDDCVETDGLPDVSALRFLSDTATDQPRAYDLRKQGFTSLWSKYDEEGGETQDKRPKTTMAQTPPKTRATTVPTLQAATLPPTPTQVASAFTAAFVPLMVAPVATASETPSKKSKKRSARPSWPGPIDKIHAALKAHEEAWKKHCGYERWLSERNDIAADPTRSKTLFNHFEEQRLALLNQIHAAHLQEAPKK